MQLPDRVTVPTCIGCGAMSQYGTCERGCSESRLDLVRAVDLDTVTALASGATLRASAYGRVAETLASRRPGPTGYETAYRSVQTIARAVLRRHPGGGEPSQDPIEPERATTWWCSRCGGLDAPQPCLGICVWREVEWVNTDVYERERGRALLQHESELRLRAVLQRLGWSTPRERQWKLGWLTLQEQAQDSLRAAPPPTGVARPASG